MNILPAKKPKQYKNEITLYPNLDGHKCANVKVIDQLGTTIFIKKRFSL